MSTRTGSTLFTAHKTNMKKTHMQWNLFEGAIIPLTWYVSVFGILQHYEAEDEPRWQFGWGRHEKLSWIHGIRLILEALNEYIS